MGTSVTGRLALDSGEDQRLTAFRIIVTDEDSLSAARLNKADASDSASSRADQIRADGTYSVTIDPASDATTATRTLTLTVYTSCLRKLASKAMPEAASGTTDFGEIDLKATECFGYTVTLGGTASVQINPLRLGNAVRPLVDGEDAFSHVCDVMNKATTKIYVLQLAFDTPKSSAPNPAQESPEVVLAFQTPYDPTTGQPPTLAPNARPEQILITKRTSTPTFDVRVIMSGSDTTTKILEDGLLALLGVSALLIAWHSLLAITITFLIVDLLLLAIKESDFQGASDRLADVGASRWNGKKGIEQYLKDYGSTVNYKEFPMPLAQWVHSKMVIADDTEAVSVGSPFHQSYWDTHHHYIYEPRRGSASDEYVPVHDISMAVRGPIVADMRDCFRLHWNVADSSTKLGKSDVASEIATPADAGEHIASVQLVRTLNGKLFDGLSSDTDKPAFLSGGEQGVLEAYLRAIESAKTYIYIENQYFVNKTIARALVAALNDPNRPSLQIIILVNVTPDAPFYPFWQWRRITQIRKDAGDNVARIGFFTTWSHDAPLTNAAMNVKQPKAMISANYLHSKFAMADDVWLTIGSANLDGLSLETSDYLGFLPGQDRRDHEVSLNILCGIEGAQDTDAIEAFRRRLWAEHLGFVKSDGTLDTGNSELNAGSQSGSGGWLGLFHRIAQVKAGSLASDPTKIDPSDGRILEYPTNTLGQFHLFFGRGHGKGVPERDFLEKTGVALDKVDLISKVHPYDFLTNEFG